MSREAPPPDPSETTDQTPRVRLMVRCRLVETIDEIEACEELQRRAFGYDDIDVVPTNELRSIQKAGGLVLGAFCPETPEPIGFCFGMLGRDPDTGQLYHASRMVGVDPAWRRQGVALVLKLAQRDLALAQGLRCMRWTFDPLQLGNARLNILRLGAYGFRYHRDLYGPATSSPLHLGVGTDRLEVCWDLERPLGQRPLRPAALPADRLVEMPIDLHYLQTDMPAIALEWRLRVRSALETALGRGQRVVGLIEGERGAPFYVLGEQAAPTSASPERTNLS